MAQLSHLLALLSSPAVAGRVVHAASAGMATFLASLAPGRRVREPEGAGETPVPSELAWTSRRLQDTLRREFGGERMFVVANREPVIHQRQGKSVVELHPASGLVTALEPIVRSCAGVWVAHGSGSADRETADTDGHFKVSRPGATYMLRRVWLSAAEEQGYYYGFANEAIWPLCHLAHAQPVFRRSDFEHYRVVNQRFAEAVASEVTSDAPIVLVQDYHFALVPRMLRARFPRATILTFWHIPWPNAERFGICPYQRELLEGLLGSSIVGFQTPLHCRNFNETVERTLEARVEREDATVVHGGHVTAVRAYPISIDWSAESGAQVPSVEECRRTVRQEFGVRADTPLLVCIDRLDYTKGFEERLLSFGRLLESLSGSDRKPVLLQVAAPSRHLIDRYREFSERVALHVDALNDRFADGVYRPVLFVNRHCDRAEIVRYYRAADLCYVSSLHDGMNLVAKEFVAARDDEDGVLLLSRFAGAARELTEAMIVNPYDIDGVADLMAAALAMPQAERRDRMRAMRSQVGAHNVYRWAGEMLGDAAHLRHRERLRGRLSVR